MQNKKQNASQFPKRYFGLHFAPGVAQYQDGENEPYKIFLNQDTINEMDRSFEGKPVFVKHREDVKPEKLNEADGFVVKSFFNKTDGKQWAEFLITSDAGHDAISSGYQLSNAYIVKNTNSGGEWHAVPYEKEVISAEYEHLALVPNPRYKESVVMTPDEFKQYNEQKNLELKRLTNSKEEKSMFSFFKKTKVENSVDFESMSVVLPKSGKEITLSTLINEADMAMDQIDKMGELMKAHEATKMELEKCKAELAMALEKASKVEVQAKVEDAKEGDVKESNPADTSKEDPKVEPKPLVEVEDDSEKKMNSHFNKLKQAERVATVENQTQSVDPVELGNQLFGSK